jgi:predicted nuclease of restriction endonuclease-like RecB superfamily
LLPRTPAALHAPSKQVARLAREVCALRPDVRVEIAPPAIVAEGVYLCPDVRIEETYVEIIGFWTGEYLARKRRAYEAAGLQVLFCVDELRGCADEELPADVLGYGKAVKAADLLRRIA